MGIENEFKKSEEPQEHADTPSVERVLDGKDMLPPDVAKVFIESLAVGNEVALMGEKGRWTVSEIDRHAGTIRVYQKSDDGTVRSLGFSENAWHQLHPIPEKSPRRRMTMADTEVPTKEFMLLNHNEEVLQLIDQKLEEYQKRLVSKNPQRVLDARMKLAVLETLRRTGALEPVVLWESMKEQYKNEPNAREVFANAVAVAKEYNRPPSLETEK